MFYLSRTSLYRSILVIGIIVDLRIAVLFQKYGKIDVIVSNAAVNPSVDPLLRTSESILDKLWEINVKATVLLLQVNVLGEE